MCFILASGALFSSYFQADLFGKFIFLAIFALSILSWTLIVQKFLLLRQVRHLGRQLRTRFGKELHHPLNFDVGEASHPFAGLLSTFRSRCIEVLNKNASFAGESAVYLSSADINWVEGALHAKIAAEATQLSRNLYLLAVVKGLAPFLGLLGTVWGILLTFTELQAHSMSSANSAMLGGLAMALGTTVAGLLVAIPALIGHSYLRARLADLREEMDQFSHEALGAVELQYRRVD